MTCRHRARPTPWRCRAGWTTKPAFATCDPGPAWLGWVLALPTIVPSSSTATTVRPGGSRIQEQQIDARIRAAGQVFAAVHDLPLDRHARPAQVLRDPGPLLDIDARHVAAGVPRRIGQPDRRVPVRRPDLHDVPGAGGPQDEREELGRRRLEVAQAAQAVRLDRVVRGTPV